MIDSSSISDSIWMDGLELLTKEGTPNSLLMHRDRIGCASNIASNASAIFSGEFSLGRVMVKGIKYESNLFWVIMSK